jgi:hypothetical protein
MWADVILVSGEETVSSDWRYKGQSYVECLCALSGQEVFGRFLFLTQMHSDCCSVPGGHVGGIRHTSFGRRWTWWYTILAILSTSTFSHSSLGLSGLKIFTWIGGGGPIILPAHFIWFISLGIWRVLLCSAITYHLAWSCWVGTYHAYKCVDWTSDMLCARLVPVYVLQFLRQENSVKSSWADSHFI